MSDNTAGFDAGQGGGGAALGKSAVFVAMASNAGAWGGQKRAKRFWLQSMARELLPGERVANCLRVRSNTGSSGVALLYSPSVQKSHLGGLQTCGSPWACPVCSAKIAVRRRDELQQAVATWRGRGGKLVMVTYTLRHGINDRASVLVDALLAGYRALHQSRLWRKLKEKYEIVGQVRGLEVTFGEKSGFHPHSHEILFVKNNVDIDALQNELRAAWLHELGRLGRNASWENGLQVDNADQRVADYVAKWGHDPVDEYWTIAKELTQGLQKVSREGNMSVWQLLEAYHVTSFTSIINDWGTKFVDYALAFKGKSQLQFSTGFRKLLELDDEKTDEELVDETREDSILLALLTPKQWKAIINYDARAELLTLSENAVKTGELAQFNEFLDRVGAAGVVLALPAGPGGVDSG